MGLFVLLSLAASSLIAGLRKERNEARASEERYRVLMEAASDAIGVIDEAGEILFVNPVAERLFSERADQLVGGRLEKLVPAEAYQGHLSQLKSCPDSRKAPIALQLAATLWNGQNVLLEMTLGAFSRHGQNLFTAIIRDITAGQGALRPPQPATAAPL
jgi:PAS domain S-box-containing protein